MQHELKMPGVEIVTIYPQRSYGFKLFSPCTEEAKCARCRKILFGGIMLKTILLATLLFSSTTYAAPLLENKACNEQIHKDFQVIYPDEITYLEGWIASVKFTGTSFSVIEYDSRNGYGDGAGHEVVVRNEDCKVVDQRITWSE
jgi:hypothetical protein